MRGIGASGYHTPNPLHKEDDDGFAREAGERCQDSRGHYPEVTVNY